MDLRYNGIKSTTTYAVIAEIFHLELILELNNVASDLRPKLEKHHDDKKSSSP
jgi:hypothetical protein